MELFILTVKPIENKYTRTLIFFAYFCNKQIHCCPKKIS